MVDRDWLIDRNKVMSGQSPAAVRAHISQVIGEVAGTHERVSVTRNGSRVTVILAVENYESLLWTRRSVRSPSRHGLRQNRRARCPHPSGSTASFLVLHLAEGAGTRERAAVRPPPGPSRAPLVGPVKAVASTRLRST
jgi:prevent-host-death family protein